MPNIEHRDAPIGEIHKAHNWEYADQATREAASGFTSADVRKLALQASDNTLWMLTSHSPITWVQMTGGGGGGASGPAGGVLSGTYPNPGFAADMATQAELDAHTTNTSNPHSVTAAQVGAMTNPMTTAGDIIVGGASGTPTRAAKGGNNTVWGVDGTGAVGYKPDPAGGGGTVTSVGMTVPSDLSVSGSPVTNSGTLAVTRNNQSANTVLAGPPTGAAATPAYRALVPADLPDASTTAKGVVELATSAETTAGLAVQASDTRLNDARTPTAHKTSHESGGGDALTGNLDANARVGVRKNSAGSTFLRRRLNLIEGSNVTITVTDDAGGEEVDVTIAAAGSGGGHTIQDEGTPLTARTNLNFVGAGVTVTDDSANNATKVTVASVGGTPYYAQSIGDGSATTIDVVHNLGSSDVLVQIREVATDTVIFKDWSVLSVNAVRLVFTTAPTTNQYRVVVAAASGAPVTGSSITVEEADGTPSVANINKIKVTNGTLTDEGGGVVSIATGGGGGATTSTVRVPINLSNPRSASFPGNSFWTVSALTAWDAGHWEFLKDVEGRVYGTVAIPHNVAGTANAKLVLALGANATSGVTRLTVGTKAVADAESLNPASFTAETAQDITVPATARLRKDVTFPASGSLTEVVAADDILIVEITHNGDHANDTLAVNTEIYAAWLQIDVTG